MIAEHSLLNNPVTFPETPALSSTPLTNYTFQKGSAPQKNQRTIFYNLQLDFSTRNDPESFERIHSSLKPLIKAERRQELVKDACLLGRSSKSRNTARKQIQNVANSVVNDIHEAQASGSNVYINIRPKGSLRALQSLIEKLIGKDLPSYLKTYFEKGDARELSHHILQKILSNTQINILPHRVQETLKDVFLNGVWSQVPSKIRKIEIL